VISPRHISQVVAVHDIVSIDECRRFPMSSAVAGMKSLDSDGC